MKTQRTIRGHKVEIVLHENGSHADIVTYTLGGQISALTAHDVPVAGLKRALRETAEIMRALPEQAETVLPDERLLAYVRRVLGLTGYEARAMAQNLATGTRRKAGADPRLFSVRGGTSGSSPRGAEHEGQGAALGSTVIDLSEVQRS